MNGLKVAGIVFAGIMFGALGGVKVFNELKMTKAYDRQAAEQKRMADLMETEKDLRAVEFSAVMSCEITRARVWVNKKTGEIVSRQDTGYPVFRYQGDIIAGGVKTFITCSSK